MKIEFIKGTYHSRSLITGTNFLQIELIPNIAIIYTCEDKTLYGTDHHLKFKFTYSLILSWLLFYTEISLIKRNKECEIFIKRLKNKIIRKTRLWISIGKM